MNSEQWRVIYAAAILDIVGRVVLVESKRRAAAIGVRLHQHRVFGVLIKVIGECAARDGRRPIGDTATRAIQRTAHHRHRRERTRIVSGRRLLQRNPASVFRLARTPSQRRQIDVGAVRVQCLATFPKGGPQRCAEFCERRRRIVARTAVAELWRQRRLYRNRLESTSGQSAHSPLLFIGDRMHSGKVVSKQAISLVAHLSAVMEVCAHRQRRAAISEEAAALAGAAAKVHHQRISGGGRRSIGRHEVGQLRCRLMLWLLHRAMPVVGCGRPHRHAEQRIGKRHVVGEGRQCGGRCVGGPIDGRSLPQLLQIVVEACQESGIGCMMTVLTMVLLRL